MEAVVEEVVEAETDAVVAVVAETLEIAIIGSRKAMVEVVAVAGVVEDMVEEVAMVRAADTEVSFSKFELSHLLYITSNYSIHIIALFRWRIWRRWWWLWGRGQLRRRCVVKGKLVNTSCFVTQPQEFEPTSALSPCWLY